MTAIALILATTVTLQAPHVVAVSSDGRCEAVTVEIDSQVSGADHLWVWSDQSAPRRVMPSADHRQLSEDSARLVVRAPARPDGTPRAGTVIAAPVLMWEEVPEELLPRWQVSGKGVVRVPVDRQRQWRLRYIAPGEGTWWLDVRSSQQRVVLAPAGCDDIEAAVQRAGGEPAPGARVRVYQVDAGGSDLRLLSSRSVDPRGRLVMRSVPDQEKVLVVIDARDAAPLAVWGRPHDLPPRLRLPEGAGLVGRCVDEQGLPLAGVEVHLETWLAVDAPLPWSAATSSDETGAWTLDDLPGGEALLTVRAAGRVPLRRRLVLEDSRADLGQLALEPGAQLTALVRDDVGAPIEGAEVQVDGVAVGTTDARGSVTIEAVPAAREVTLQAKAPAYLAGERRVMPPLPETATLELVRAFTLTGRLIDADGAPVDQGTAMVQTESGRIDAVSLDASGRFDLELAPGLELSLTGLSPTAAPVTISVEPGLPGETRDVGDLEAPRGLVITGKVVKRDDGAPVAGARVWAPRPSSRGALMAWFQHDLLEARTSSDGSFRVSGAPVMPLVLRIDAPGHARAMLRVVPEQDQAELDAGEIELSRGATLRILPEPPADGAMAEVDLGGQGLELDMLSAVVRDNEAVIRNVPAGRAWITIATGRSQICETETDVPDAERVVEVRCEDRRLRVRGETLLGDKVVDGGTLMWSGSPRGGPAIVSNCLSPGGLRQQRTLGGAPSTIVMEVGRDGRFSSGEVRPGPWQVIYLGTDGSSTQPREVTLPDVPEYDLTLRYDGLELSGRVVDEEGGGSGAMTTCRVRELSSGAFATVGPDGGFRLTGLAPGLARLVARCGERSSEVQELELSLSRDQEPVELRVERDENGTILVRAADSRGVPAPGAVVFAQADSGQMVIGSTDSQGSAELRFSRPRPAQIRGAALAAGSWVLGSWQPWDEAVPGLDLMASGTGALEVTSSEVTGPLVVTAPGDWDLGALIARIGDPPMVSPRLAADLTGLPPGTYRVLVGDASRTVTVRSGELARAELP